MTPDPASGYERFSAPDASATDGLERLAGLANLMLAMEREVETYERTLKNLKAKLRDVAEAQIPDLMEELGLQTFTTKTGLKIIVKETLRHSIAKGRKEAAYRWLTDNGYGAVVKRRVGVQFAAGEEEEWHSAEDALKAAGFEVEVEDAAAPATIGALLRELLAEGSDVPLDLFGAWRQRAAKVTK